MRLFFDLDDKVRTLSTDTLITFPLKDQRMGGIEARFDLYQFFLHLRRCGSSIGI